MSSTKLKTYRAVWHIAKSHDHNPIKLISIIALFLLVSTLIGISLPYLLKLLIDQSQSPYISLNYDDIFSLSNLYLLAIAYAVGWLIAQTLNQIQNRVSALFFRNFESVLAYRGLENYFHLKYEEQKKIEVGVFNADLWRGADGFSQITYTVLFVILPVIIKILAMVWVLAQNIDLIYAVYFLIFSIITLALSLIITFKTKDIFTDMYESRNSLNQFIVEKISSSYDMKVNASLDYEMVEFKKRIINFKEKSSNNYQRMLVFMIYQLVFVGLFLLFFMILSVSLFEKNQLTSGDFVLISTYIISLTMPLMMMSQSIIRLRGDFITTQKYYDYFNLESDHYTAVKVDEKKSIFFQFEHAEFRLGKHLIRNFNFKIEQGKCYVAIGRTGIGKTSFIHYLIGLQQIESGDLKYKNIDISHDFSKEIFKEIAFVSQNPVVYSGTLRQNLVHNSQYSYTDEELNLWLDRFHLSDLIQKNKLKLDDDIQEIYKSFSGGEKQRISIIRALLKRPQLLILDEPTAALDERTSLELMPIIRENVSTIFMISHANYAVNFADEILDFNQLIAENSQIEEVEKRPQ